MKKLKFLPLVASLSLLAGCGNSLPKEGGAVPKGKEISVKKAKEQMDVATQAMEDDDALGLSMDKAYMHYDFSAETSYPKGKSEKGSVKFKRHAHLDDIAFHAGVRGMAATKVEDLKASASANGKFDVGGSLVADSFRSNYKAPSGTYGLKAYLDQNQVYFDLSDTKLQSMFETISNENKDYQGFSDNAISTLTMDAKVKVDAGLTQEDLPLVSKDNLKNFTDGVSKKIERIASKGGKLKAQEHGDGTYSYSVETKDLDGAYDFMDEVSFTEAFRYEKKSGEKEGDTTTSVLNVKHDIKRSFNVNNYSLSFIFNDKGISSIGATIDVHYSYENTYSVSDYTFGTKVNMNYAVNGRILFLQGQDVNVDEVTDKDAYKVSDQDLKNLADAVDDLI